MGDRFSVGVVWPFLLLVLVGAGVYANSLAGPFVFDDGDAIVENRDIRSLWPLWRVPEQTDRPSINSRPVVRLSLAVNYALGGLDVRSYRVFNIAVHILCALVLFGVVRRTLLSAGLEERFGRSAQGLALVWALVWMVHPLQSQCINYIAQRSESMVALFYLLVLYGAIRGIETGNRIWYVVAVLSCALGMGSKEVMVTAPLMIVFYERIFQADSWGQILEKRRILYAGLAATWVLLAMLLWSGPHGGSIGYTSEITAVDYALNQCVVIVDYLKLAIWPHPLLLDYGFARKVSLGEIVPHALALVLGLGAAIAALCYWPRIGFLVAWFWIVLAPTSSLVPIVNEVGAERRVYLALAGLVGLVVLGGYEALKGAEKRWLGEGGAKWLGVCVVLVAVGGLAWATTLRNLDYRSAIALWRTVVEAAPENSRGHNSLGYSLKEEGQLQEALAHFRRALQLDPDYVYAHNNTGTVLQRLGQTEAAIGHYHRAVELNPRFAKGHNNLAITLQMSGRLEEAVAHYRRAVELEADLFEAHYNLAVLLVGQNRVEEGVVHFRRAVEIEPTRVEGHYGLGVSLQRLGRFEDAARHYRRVLEIRPDYGEARRALEQLLRGGGGP